MIASETASRHQPMNWRDSIGFQTSSRKRRSQSVKSMQRLVPYSENKGYASNPRRFLDLFNFDSDLQTFTTPISLKIGMK